MARPSNKGYTRAELSANNTWNQLVQSELSRECKLDRHSLAAKHYMSALELFYHGLDAKEGIGSRYKRETIRAIERIGRSVLGESYKLARHDVLKPNNTGIQKPAKKPASPVSTKSILDGLLESDESMSLSDADVDILGFDDDLVSRAFCESPELVLSGVTASSSDNTSEQSPFDAQSSASSLDVDRLLADVPPAEYPVPSSPARSR